MKIVDELHRHLTASITFPLTNYLFNRRHVGRDFRELARTQWISADELEHIQLGKVRRQLARAAESVPFYQRRFREVGLDPRDVVSLEDLAAIPPLTREDLTRHHRDLVDVRHWPSIEVAEARGPGGLGKPIPFSALRRHKLVRHSSSGSTGEPVVYYEDGSTSAASWAFERLIKGWYQIPRGPREVRMMRLATEFVPGGTAGALRRLLWRHVALPGINLREEDYAASFETVRTFRPDVLWGFTSALRGLAEYIVDGARQLPHRPRVVITWAEPVLDYEEELLFRAFGCPVTNLYSSHEVGHVACRCPEGSLHVDQSHLLVQVADGSADLGEEGAGELLITMLFDSAMPFIRYSIGDLGRTARSSCACGRSLQVIESLYGRTYELYTTVDGRMLSPNFWLHLFRRDHVAGFIKRFQVTYKRDGSISILVTRDETHPVQDDGDLRRLVADNLGGNTAVAWHYVDTIPPEPSGKVPIVRFEKETD